MLQSDYKTIRCTSWTLLVDQFLKLHGKDKTQLNTACAIPFVQDDNLKAIELLYQIYMMIK